MVEFEVDSIKLQCETLPDLFSPKGLDIGTKLLLESMSKQNLAYQTAVDWGCGWGAIALWLAKNNPNSRVIGLDSDIGAVKIASQNTKYNNLDNVDVIASHGFLDINDNFSTDLVASNPPTHRGREVVEQMIAQSFEKLNNDGNLLIVVEARLKPWVARQMKQVFGNYKIIRRSTKHVVLLATKVVQ